MLTLMDRRPNHTCQGYSRREFLRVGGLGLGGLGLGGLSLADLMASRAAAAQAGLPVTGKSVVLLFLQGGPPHIEFFDPKMTAPSEIRSITGEVRTNLPGITFGSTFPRLAKMTDKIAVVRSYGSRNSGHTYESVATGRNPLKAAMSALYSRVVGINDAKTGMPTSTLVLPEAVSPGLKLRSNFETGAMHTLTDPGDLGPSYRAFDPAGGGELKQNMEMRLDPRRLADRRGLLGQLDQMRRQIDATGQMESAETYRQQAFEVITRGAAEAFDLSKESPATLERYDTQPLFDMSELTRWYDLARASNLLGMQMLMARRLVERGCGFVTVSDCGWDYHANNNSPKYMAAMWPMGRQVDHAVSAFIEDLHARGMQDDVLLLVTGEMGRTPRINKNGGRDHYGNLTSLMVAGGGLKMGQVIGQSDRQAAEATTTPYDPTHLFATIMHTLFDLGQLRIDTRVSKDVTDVMTSGHPVAELM